MKKVVEALRASEQKLVNYFLLGILTFWGILSSTGWISDSEFWPITLSSAATQFESHPAWLYKPLFHFALSWLYFLELDSSEHIQAAKILFSSIAVLGVFLFFKLLSRKIPLKNAAAAVAILLSSSLFFAHFPTIRSDIMASTIAIGFLLLIERSSRKVQWSQTFFLFLLGSLLLFLVTPKAVYLVVILFLFSVLESSKLDRLRLIRAVGILFICLLFVWLILFWSMPQLSYLRALRSALLFHLNIQAIYTDYFNAFNVPYFRKDFLFFALLVFFLLAQIVSELLNTRKNGWLFSSYSAIGLLTISISLLQRPSLPFFIASLIPILIISLLPTLQKFKFAHLMAILISVQSYSLFIAGRPELYFVSNKLQLETISKVEKKMHLCGAKTVFDGLGLFPRFPGRYLQFLSGDDSSTTYYALKTFLDEKPDIVLQTPRMIIVNELFEPTLSSQYSRYSVGYWIRQGIHGNCAKEFEDLPYPFVLFGYAPIIRL